eukprot:6601044-Alexandrium_andersonii.AAC.1
MPVVPSIAPPTGAQPPTSSSGRRTWLARPLAMPSPGNGGASLPPSAGCPPHGHRCSLVCRSLSRAQVVAH